MAYASLTVLSHHYLQRDLRLFIHLISCIFLEIIANGLPVNKSALPLNLSTELPSVMTKLIKFPT